MADTLWETKWSAMGGRAHAMLVGGSAALIDQVQQRVDDLERRWSRFIPTSDISRLNADRGGWVDVHNDTMTLIGCLLRARTFTGGSFEPFLLDRLLAAGYDRTFDDLVGKPADDPAADPDAEPAGPPCLPPLGAPPIELDRKGGRVRLTSEYGIDPGGLGKGLAADLATHDLIAAGAKGAMVNLGGDLRVRGASPGRSWRVDLEEPRAPDRTLLTLGVVDGAVATSSRLRRTWQTGGQDRHHLIDPTTGRSGETGVLAVTVLASDCWWAEALTKAAYFAGPDRGKAILENTGVHGTVIDDAGVRHDTAGFSDVVR
jgi:thiamine biosynthesis lipoprotein